jgi:Leucine-rich repeat (LRR) protein
MNSRVLQLDDNKLVALPKSLNGLGHLEELWLNGNAVKEIPEGLYMISNMRKPA